MYTAKLHEDTGHYVACVGLSAHIRGVSRMGLRSHLFLGICLCLGTGYHLFLGMCALFGDLLLATPHSSSPLPTPIPHLPLQTNYQEPAALFSQAVPST